MSRSRLFMLIVVLALLLYNQLIIIYMGIDALLYYSLIPTIMVFTVSFMIYRGMKITENAESRQDLLTPDVEKAIVRLKGEIEELRRRGINEELIRMELILAENLVRIGRYDNANEVLAMVIDDIKSLGGHVNRNLARQYRRLVKEVSKRLRSAP